MAAMEAEIAAFEADTSKKGKARYSKWRMEHAKTHGNVQPGAYGEPFFDIELDDFILDLLHLAELNIPKIAWKHAIMNNASDDAREEISAFLKEIQHPLDCRHRPRARPKPSYLHVDWREHLPWLHERLTSQAFPSWVEALTIPIHCAARSLSAL